MKFLSFFFLLLITSCVARAKPVANPVGDGARWFMVSCPWSATDCMEVAAEACEGKGYEIDQRYLRPGKVRNFSAWRDGTLVRCKN